MPDVVRPEDLRERVNFQQRTTSDDGYGNPLPAGDFATVYTFDARLKPLRGGETVMAGRLQGRQPYILTVRNATETRAVDETWRVVDVRDSDRVFAIKAPPTDPDGKRVWLEFLVELGDES